MSHKFCNMSIRRQQ